jgi:hypothetical protein
MATTTNYGWTTPDDTALVKDGAAAIRTLGSSVDTTTKALNPSTTLGDIEYRSSTANTNTRLGIGSTGQVLTVTGGVPTWAAVSGGGITLISTTTLTGSGVSLTSIPTTYTNLRFVITGYYASSADFLYMRFNNDTGGGYYANAENFDSTSVFSTPTGASALGIIKAYNTSGDTYLSYAEGRIPNYTDTTGGQFMQGQGYGGDTRKGWNFSGVYSNRSAAITRIDLFQGAGNLTAGTIYLYGEK